MNAFTIDAQGVTTHEAPPELVEAAQPRLQEEREISEAQKRLQARREGRGQLIHSLVVDGDTWFVKQLNFEELSLAALLIQRDSRARVKIGQRKILQSLIVAALHCSVVCGLDDPEPFLSLEDAEDYVTEPGTKTIAAELFNKTIELNPELLPRKN